MTAPDVRTAAQAEAEQRWGVRDPGVIHPSALMRADDRMRNEFVLGAVWGAALVTPTREQVVDELRKHKLIHASVSRKSAFCRCNPSLTAGTDNNLEWFEKHQADAVLALMQGMAEERS